MLDSEASQLARICNRAKLSSLLSEHFEGRQNHERVLWSLINLEIFLRVFKPHKWKSPAWRSISGEQVDRNSRWLVEGTFEDNLIGWGRERRTTAIPSRDLNLHHRE